jgi:3-oxosteroid 1-dehydrogenase
VVPFGYDAPDLEADVVVVGAGAAGFAAAVSAAAAGAEVLILEKEQAVGGTTKKSGGWYWVPNNRFLRERGEVDAKEDALRYMARLSRPDMYDSGSDCLGLPSSEYQQLEAYYDNASVVDEQLAALGVLQRFCADSIPDYYAQLPEDKVPYGRVLQPLRDDGSPGDGGSLVDQLHAGATRLGAQVVCGHAVQRFLVNDEGDVVGVVALHADERVVVRARRAVVIANGGFAHNAGLRRNYLPGPVFGSAAALGTTGDLIGAALELGSDLSGMNSAALSAFPLELALSKSPELQSFAQAPGDSFLFVDRQGRRVVNEKLQYNELGRIFWEWDARRAEFRNLLLFMIWDQPCQDFHDSLATPNLMRLSTESQEHVLRADNLTDLRAAIAERLERLSHVSGGFALAEGFSENLAGSVERFNGFAASGHDDDFGRGETPIELWFNGRVPIRDQPAPNPTMHPLSETGPYYATIIAPAVIETKGGPRINTRAQVVDPTDTPIGGLYGAGNCVGGWTGQAYWAGGATIGPAMTFGHIAGANAAKEPLKPVSAGAPA